MLSLKHVARVNPPTPEFDLLPEDAEIPFVPLEAVWPGKRFDPSRRRLKEEVATGYTRFREGDILVPKITPTFQADRTVIAHHIEGGVAAGTTELHVVRVGPAADRRYIRYLLSSKRFLDEGEASMIGVAGQKRVPEACLRDLPVWISRKERQVAVANFLDTETTRIDALMGQKLQLIHLLFERFDALVWDAITGRIHLNRKRSRLSWIDSVPEHWDTPTVSVNFELQLGKMLNADAAAGPEQYPYMRNTNVQWDRIDLDDVATMNFDMRERLRYRLVPDDLLVCEGGEVGRAAVWQDQLSDCFFQKAIHRVRPRSGANSRYLMYCLRAAAKRSVFSIEGNQSTIVHLTGEQLRVHRFPWPPAQEQLAIVARLDQASTHAREAQRLIDRQIAHLAEHRQALITAAVTGELEIPGAAA